MNSASVLNNRYRLLSQIAAGGMAVVHKAQDMLLNRVVAVKILRESHAADPNFQARFQREAEAAANLNHVNIVTVYDVGHDAGRHYIVMEYVDGQDLKQIIRAEAPLTVQRAVDIAIQMCAALGAAHRAGLVHCDVKPQNVLLTTEGRVKVTDFGIARALSQASPAVSDTVWGTPQYIAPEQAAGEAPTPASDVYAAGVILYEMLAGRLPFEGDSHTQLALAHMRDEPPPLASLNPAVPAQIDLIVRTVMSKEPALRYRNADQLATVLIEYRNAAEQATGFAPVVRSPIGQTQIRPPLAAEAAPISADEGFDWLGWLLGGIAAVAVIGLIPLWLMVARAYSSSAPATPVPPPGQTVEPTAMTLPSGGSEVLVPGVVGLSRDQAAAALSQAGLRAVEGAPRFSADVPAGDVIEQTPAAGDRVPSGSVVAITISNGPQVAPVPNLIGLTLAPDIEAGLEQAGWEVFIEPVYSTDPISEVLGLTPPPFTQLAAGEPLTVTVSGGITLTLDAAFGDLIALDSALLADDQIRPGDIIDVTFLWRALDRIPTPYIRFIHVIDQDGDIWQQQDSEPQPPTTSWPRDLTLPDHVLLQMPPNALPGEYRLLVGFYPVGSPPNRLPLTEPGQSEDLDDRALVHALTVALP